MLRWFSSGRTTKQVSIIVCQIQTRLWTNLSYIPFFSVGFTIFWPLFVWYMKQSNQLMSTDCNLASEIVSNSLLSIGDCTYFLFFTKFKKYIKSSSEVLEIKHIQTKQTLFIYTVALIINAANEYTCSDVTFMTLSFFFIRVSRILNISKNFNFLMTSSDTLWCAITFDR